MSSFRNRYSFDSAETARPIFLNLVTALLTLLAALSLRETGNYQSNTDPISSKTAFAQTWRVAKWIAHTPFALIVILAAATIDSAIRMFITLNSEYYRQISFPEVAFGLIGAVIALQGMVVARFREMTRIRTQSNFLIISSPLHLLGPLLSPTSGFSPCCCCGHGDDWLLRLPPKT